MEQLIQDVRFGLRVLSRSPGFAIAALICVALGVGVTTTIFSAVNGILLRPLPFPRSEDLFVVHSQNLEQGVTRDRVSYPDCVDWRDGSPSVAQLGLWLSNFPTITGEGEPERIEGALLSGDIFGILGVDPFMGRGFLPIEETPGKDHVVVLSHGLWQRRYGGDRSILGRTIQLSGQLYEIVGIMPAGFSFPEGTQMWSPLALDAARERHADRQFSAALGRVKRGATVAQASAEIAGISKRIQIEFSKQSAGWSSDVQSLRDELLGVLQRPILIFQAAAVLVLLIACANVANLMLARSSAREREIAIRAAIGADRRRVFTQLVTESLVLALGGGALGALIAVGGVRLLVQAFPDGVPSYLHLSLDTTVLLFTIVLALVTGLLFGIAPAFRATRVQLVTTLRDGGRGIGGSRLGRLVRNGLVLVEVALSLVVLITATLLVRSDRNLESELGFQAQGLLSVRVPIPMPKYVDAKRDTFYNELFARIAALPGVQAVGSAPSGVPMISAEAYGRPAVEVEGRPLSSGDESGAIVHAVSLHYLETLGIRFIRGRGFVESDLQSPVGSVIVNEAFARHYFGAENPIGRRVRVTTNTTLGKEYMTVIGVVANFRQDRPPQAISPAMFAYRPFYPGGQTLVIRTSLENPVTIVPSIRSIVHAIDPALPVYMVQTLDQAVGRGLWRQRLQARVLEIFGGLAVLLALFGIYGVVSYTIAQRTHELGLRVALGASSRDVLLLVVRQGLQIILSGIALGILASLALTRFVAGLLYGVDAGDVTTFVLVSIVLTVIAIAATLIPARRATRVDPLSALRSE